jgi:signal transduction histidine kinase
MRRLATPALALLAVLALAAVDVYGLLLGLRSHARLRQRLVVAAAERLRPALPSFEAALAGDDGPVAMDAVLKAALERGFERAEILTSEGNVLRAQPAPIDFDHWPVERDIRALEQEPIHGYCLVKAPIALFVHYARLSTPSGPLLLRVSADAREVVDDLADRRVLLIGHLLVLLLLAVVAILAALHSRSAASERSSEATYELALARLRDQGRERTAHHQDEIRRLSEALQDRAAMAHAGELTAGMAHEVRNGLGTILGYARLLEGLGPEATTLETARRIREECRGLEQVVGRFLDLVRNEEIQNRPFDVAAQLRRLIGREKGRGPGATIELTGTPQARIDGDEELLDRAFENLIRNAREAAGSGGAVTVHVDDRETAVEVSVADDGPGIAIGASGTATITPFSTTKRGGVGLGLPIALKIVRLHDGELRLERRGSGGTVASVWLPKRPGASSR